MKTPDDIKKGLRFCDNNTECKNLCPYWEGMNSMSDCRERLSQDALAYIQQLEAELEAVKRERDAAAKDLIKVAKSQIICDVCSNDHRKDPICMSHQGDCSECSLHCPCDGCFDEWELRITGANFAWRGVCPENTEVQEDEKG